jgi:hypothetical protein
VDLSDEWASLLDGSAASEGDPPVVTEAAPQQAAQPSEEPAEFEVAFDAPEEAESAVSQPAAQSSIQESSSDAVEEFSIAEEFASLSPEVSEAPAVPAQVEEAEFAASESASAHGAHAETPAETPQFAEMELPEPVAEISAHLEEPAAPELSHSEFAAQASAIHEGEASVSVPEPAAKTPPPKDQPLELELDQDYELVLDPEPLVPAYDQKPPEPISVEQPPIPANSTAAHSGKPSDNGFGADQFLSELAAEMGDLGLGELSPEFSAGPEAHAKPAEPAARIPGGPDAPLKEVFDEFRAELGEMGSDDEDLETHYNLGVAFREMGLLEEAISEFQKVAQACDRGRPFRYAMQNCTLLGLAFIDKGQPHMAAIWYERALQTPGLGPDNALALRYDLGLAQESAGDHDAALKSFSHVYAMNIDYRDVAERIATLQKSSR